MSGHYQRTAVSALATIIGVTILMFLLLRLVPGDTTTLVLGQDASTSPEKLAELRESLGLNRPVPVQYAVWLKGAVTGDFGDSLYSGRPVAAEVIRRVPVTAALAGLTLLISSVTGVSLGTLAALHRGGAIDKSLRLVTSAGLAMPAFWVAIVVLALAARWFSWSPPVSYSPFLADPLSSFTFFLVPSLVLSLNLASSLARMARSCVLEVLHQDYVRTAYAKGLKHRTVIVRHVLRNSLIPLTTLLGLQAINMMAGTVIIEQIFNIPGVGRLMLSAIQQKDYPVVQAAALFYAVSAVAITLLVEMSYGRLNPRMSATR